MSNSKNLIITVLAVALVVLGGWTYYTLTTTVPAKAEAGCVAKIESEVIPAVTAQVTAAAQQECSNAIAQYEVVLSQLQEVPECAAVLNPGTPAEEELEVE